jgi:hypothetical protein
MTDAAGFQARLPTHYIDLATRYLVAARKGSAS